MEGLENMSHLEELHLSNQQPEIKVPQLSFSEASLETLKVILFMCISKRQEHS